MHPLFANKFSLSLGRQQKRSKINPLTNIFLLPLHLLELRTLFLGGFFEKFIIFCIFLLTSHLFEPGEPFCTPSEEKKFQKQKNLRFIKSKGKVSLSFVLNFNRQKGKRHSRRIFLRKLCLDF